MTVDVGLSYDSNGVVQVQAIQRDTGHRLPMTIEPVPDDLSWLGRPPDTASAQEPELIRVFLLLDVSSSMTGQPLIEAQTAAREFLSKCDLTTMEVGLISFSTLVALQSAATSNLRVGFMRRCIVSRQREAPISLTRSRWHAASLSRAIANATS